MYIYKITNKVNNKFYIGQTIHSIEERFNRHINDALSNRLDTHLARAIRKYGKNNFIIEKIDEATTQEELTEKEYYWINILKAVEFGYNETNSKNKCGGNTYLSKTEEELKNIKNKLQESKIGSKNPNAKKVKCKSIKTKEEFHFDTLKQMQEFFGATNHSFITKRCNGEIKCLYQKEWYIAYEENDYLDASVEKNIHRSVSIKVIDLQENKEYNFPSYAAAERYFNLPLKTFSSKAYTKGKEFTIKDRFQIKILN